MALKTLLSERIGGFFDTEKGKLVHFIRKEIKDVAERDAEDILQDVMLSMLNSVDPNKKIENLTAYIYRSIRNRIIDLYRKPKVEVSMDDTLQTDEGYTLADILSDMRYDTHTIMEKKDIERRIFEAVDRLKPDQRAIWVSTEMDGHTFEELSVLWGESIGTLLSRKHRATEKLRKALKDFMV